MYETPAPAKRVPQSRECHEMRALTAKSKQVLSVARCFARDVFRGKEVPGEDFLGRLRPTCLTRLKTHILSVRIRRRRTSLSDPRAASRQPPPAT